MQDNDLNIEDFKEIFIKSFFGETVSTQEISDYFEYESEKFMIRFSNEDLTQRMKDIIFKKFIKGMEDANTNLSNPFIEYEQNRTWDMWEWHGKGVDISEMEKPNKYIHQIKLHKLCEKLSGADIWLEQIESIYEGFKLFKQQHGENSNATAPPTKGKPTIQQTGFNLGYSETQLKVLHKALIDESFLFPNCNFEHFKNAFDGSVLKDYSPISWKEPTKGAIFIKYYFGDVKHFWAKSIILFEQANYKQLLHQSKELNNTFDTVTDDITAIDTLIKKTVNIDGI